jgi:hypothetical protein
MGRVVRRGAGFLLPVLATLALGACGGTSSSKKAAPAPVQAASGVVPSAEFKPGAGRDLVRPAGGRPVRARSEPGAINDEVSASRARSVDPCALISRADAQASVGKPVGPPARALQGPTCVYRTRLAGGVITIAVQSAPFSSASPQLKLRDRMPVSVHGRAAYCGVAGVPTMIVPLSAGRYLSVGAPCPIAASLAAKALGRLQRG